MAGPQLLTGKLFRFVGGPRGTVVAIVVFGLLLMATLWWLAQIGRAHV